jgi:hypothetical protein
MSESLFLRLLPYDDKATALAEAVAAVREGRTLNPVVHVMDPDSFRQIPGVPFAYWVSKRVLDIFIRLSGLEEKGFRVRKGLDTNDDFRFFRLYWEVQDEKRRYVPLAKGGPFSKFYDDIALVFDWTDKGEHLRVFLRNRGDHPSRNIRSEDKYFKPGLTWSQRSQKGLSVRVLPAGCIFSTKGPGIIPEGNEDFFSVLALLNSSAYAGLIGLQMAFGSYDTGILKQTPVPDLIRMRESRLGFLASKAVKLKGEIGFTNETSQIFYLPALLQVSGNTLAEKVTAWQARIAKTERQLAECQREIDDIAFRLYGIEGEDRRAMEEVTSDKWLVTSEEGNEVDSEEDQETQALVTRHSSLITADHSSLVTDLLSYTVGCTFGRWDVRFATGERQAPKLPDPFAPLPACSPGMLTGDDGLPLRETPPNHPLRIDWDGILVDDPDHQDDIVRHVREVLEVIWKERAEAIEHEACEILGFKELRDYFRKPGNGGFWMDHVRRYSKSRRKAPIYWLLQSSRKNYTLWMYYHRLDKDILFKALLNYVEPKIRLEQSRLDSLRAQKQAAGETGKGAKKLDKEIEQQDDLLSELRDFEDKLRRAANLHLEPDLNDGVVLNIAPLHELVPWKEAKSYWEELLAGKYEWSSIGKQLREKGIVR